MELWQVRYFVALAEELHFARAAERVGIGQSPLSRAIKELEGELAVRLFHRTSRSTQLTWAGQMLLEDARRILATVEHAKRSVAEVRRSWKGRLRIALCEHVASVRVSQPLASFRREEQEIELRVVDRSSARQVVELQEGLVDAGFAAISGCGKGIRAEVLWSEKWVAVLPVQHPLARQPRVSLAELAREPLLLLSCDAAASAPVHLPELFRAVNPKACIADDATNPLMLLALIEAGCGVGILSASQAHMLQRGNVEIRAIAGHVPPLRVYLLRRDEEPSAPLSRFIEGLQGTLR
jgi:DNA-binding transcriptional LysR family regulator